MIYHQKAGIIVCGKCGSRCLEFIDQRKRIKCRTCLRVTITPNRDTIEVGR